MAEMSKRAETVAWLLSKLDEGAYDEVMSWQQDMADLEYTGSTRDGRTEPVVLAEPDITAARATGAWLEREARKGTVEVSTALLRNLADMLEAGSDGNGRISYVEGALRNLATLPEQRAQERGGA